MTPLTTAEDLFAVELRDLYSAETQLVDALVKMAKSATDPDLKAALEKHHQETIIHVERLERIADSLDTSPKGRTCLAMQGLLEECAQMAEAKGDFSVVDIAIIDSAQKVEYYEIAAYCSALALAQILDLDDAAELLESTLDEESHAAEALSWLSQAILPVAVEIGA